MQCKRNVYENDSAASVVVGLWLAAVYGAFLSFVGEAEGLIGPDT